jgi:hypothetical protein
MLVRSRRADLFGAGNAYFGQYICTDLDFGISAPQWTESPMPKSTWWNFHIGITDFSTGISTAVSIESDTYTKKTLPWTVVTP